MQKMRGLIAVCALLAAGTFTNTGAASATSADWAWPGQEFLVYKAGGYYSCSVGYPGTDSSGNRFFITAGHCFRSKQGAHYVHPDTTALDIYSPDDRDTSVGWERIHMNPGTAYLDFSLVQMRPGKKVRGDGWKDIPARVGLSSVGDPVCAVGMNHQRSTCGKIVDVDTKVTMKGYDVPTLVNQGTYCSYPGDSGGAVYNDTGVLGIISSGPTKTCNDSYVSMSRIIDKIRDIIPSFRLY